ncbi:hypothetical protein SHIRM173S_10752 [Streptomyces hirsutus]
MYGVFFEDINRAADGGLYAELAQNPTFEYSTADNGHHAPDLLDCRRHGRGAERLRQAQ